MLDRSKGSKCYILTDVELDGVTLRYVSKFQYLGPIVSADKNDDKDIGKQTRRQKCCWQHADT